MKFKCPNNPEHNRFVTTAHELHDWLVDPDGEFVCDLGCIETVHRPDPDNVWTCQACGEEAVNSEL